MKNINFQKGKWSENKLTLSFLPSLAVFFGGRNRIFSRPKFS